jgi:hypothetical protein
MGKSTISMAIFNIYVKEVESSPDTRQAMWAWQATVNTIRGSDSAFFPKQGYPQLHKFEDTFSNRW